MTDTKVIARYIAGCARAKDGRGLHLNQVALLHRLCSTGTSFAIAHATAQAARRVGEAIARRAAA